MKTMKIFGGMLILLFAGLVLAQSVPQLINYQGRLTDDMGLPIDGTVEMGFRITNLQFDQDVVTDEAHTLHGTTAESLVWDDLVPASETVTDLSGNTVYVSGTDYFVDYPAGTIQRVGSGSIPDPGDILIDYTYNTDLVVLWSETISSVDVDQGIYHVKLGSVNPLTASVFSEPERYLEVNVGGERLEPRQRITSIAYALKAESVPDSAIGTSQLADDAVTSAKISDGTITGSDIGSQTIAGSNLINKTIESTQIADSTIGGGQVLDGSLSGSDIQDGSIAPADVSFNYAGSAAKGGPASDINCTGCIDFSEVSFDYAAGASKGGPATDLDCADCVESSEVADSSLTGSDIQDGTLTGSDIQDGSIAGADIGTDELGENQIQDIYVLNSGDTVTGALEVLGNIEAGQSLFVSGNVGVGTAAPDGKLHVRRSNVTGTQDVYMVRSDIYSGANSGTSYFRGIYGYADNNSWDGTTNNYGVYGWANSSANGGFAQSSNFYGLYGRATGTTYGTTGAYGLYATASGADTNWAGYFDAGNVYINNDLQVNGSNIGIGTSPDFTYGILNSTSDTPATGALLYGSGEGVRGALSGDPNDHYGLLGSQSSGVEGRAGASDEVSPRYGGSFQSHSLSSSYGVNGTGYGYSSMEAIGVKGYATNYSTGYSYGGYFTSGTDGTGQQYGVYASGADYAVFADGGYYGLYGTGEHAGVYGEVDINSTSWAFAVQGWGSNSSSGDAYGGYFRADTPGSGEHIGVYGGADGSTVSTVYGVKGFGRNDSSAEVYGGYFDTSDFGTGDHYGVYSYGRGGTGANAYGVYGRASGGANAYGVYGYAFGATGNNYGIYNASGTKSWVNPDPEDPEKSIVYATLEGGENGTYYAGRAKLENGKAVITLPDHFRKVTSPDHPVIVQVTPRSAASMGLAVTRSSNSEIIVEELYGGNGDYEFDYFAKGIRLGYEEYEPIINNVDYVPFQGNHEGMDESEMTTQEWYDSQSPGLKRIFKMNGTLRDDGKVNEDIFKDKSWKVVKDKAGK
jgi:hypothetical protein